MENQVVENYLLPFPYTLSTYMRQQGQYANADGETRMKIISDLYGKFDQDIYNLMNEKLGAQNG